MKESLKALHSSVAHLSEVVEKIDPAKYTDSAYPKAWSIADTMSHIGSGAVILSQRFDDIVAGNETDPDFSQSVWDEWNAKEPAAQVTDALVADAALLDRLQMLDEEGRDKFEFSMGPMTFDFDGFVGMRLNEQVLHTWDVEVTVDGSATLPEAAAAVLVDNLPMFVGFSGKPSGEAHDLHVSTSEPAREFILAFGKDSVALSPNEHGGHSDIELSSEAFVRLVSGRLDPKHTPRSLVNEHLDELRVAFPGY
jgi:uncharacterized protein (TIGR03083 family)